MNSRNRHGSLAKNSLVRVFSPIPCSGVLWVLLMVDVMMSFAVQMSLVRAEGMGVRLDRMREFIKRIEERDAYKRVVEKVGELGL